MMNKLLIGFMVVLGLLTAAHGKSGFFEQEESAQHLLQAEGDTFRFFRHNLICNNWNFAKFDAQDKTDAEQSLHLSDPDEKKGVVMHSHNPVACQPFTKYRLRFKSKLISYEGGPPPWVEIKLFDFNRDYFQSLPLEIPEKETGKGWIDQELVFITPHDAHVLMGYFESRGKTVCDIVFDEVYVEQLSAAEAFRPVGRKLFSVESCRGGLLGQKSIEGRDDACRFEFGFSWKNTRVRQELVFQWLEKSGETIGTETCRFSPMVGIRPEWSGVQSEWFRHYGDPADKVHCRRDRHFNISGDSGDGRLEGMLLKPKEAVAIRVRMSKDSDNNLEIQNFVLIAQPLDPAE